MKRPKFEFVVVIKNFDKSSKRVIVTPMCTFMQAVEYASRCCDISEYIHSITVA